MVVMMRTVGGMMVMVVMMRGFVLLIRLVHNIHRRLRGVDTLCNGSLRSVTCDFRHPEVRLLGLSRICPFGKGKLARFFGLDIQQKIILTERIKIRINWFFHF